MIANKFSLLAGTIPTSKEQYVSILLDYIGKTTFLTDKEVQGIVDNMDIRTYKKGDLILQEGAITTMCLFVLKGCIREYRIKNGEELTTNFYTDQQPVSCLIGNPNREPSPFFLEAVEKTIATASTPEEEEAMFKKFPRFEQICRIKVEELMTETQSKMSDYITSTPTERYLNLVKTRPELIDKVPQYQLASFIGIKPETLSRIRKKLAKGE